MTAHFVWTCMSPLERPNHRRPYDFWICIAFGCSVWWPVMGVCVFLPMLSCLTIAFLLHSLLRCTARFFQLEPRFLGHNLSTFLVYVWSRYHEGLDVNMFEVLNTRAELLPWFFLVQVCTQVRRSVNIMC